MQGKHYFNTNDGLATLSLRGLIASNPSLSLIEKTRIVYNPNHDSAKVAIISGGGSGHEPHSAGTVGKGMLAAAVCGDVFASPSAKQVISGVRAAGSKEGTILVVTNYTGDMLHFGLAREVLNAGGGAPVECIVVADDCAVGRSKGGLVGRRGISGTPLTIKILGAASEAGLPFASVVSLGKAVVANLVSIGAGLDHVTLPGRKGDGGRLPFNVCELGLGIHNEPGFEKISPIPSPQDLVSRMLKVILAQDDEERAFVPFQPEDEVVLLVNNLGGVSPLEFAALVATVLEGLAKDWNIRPVRILQGTFMTSLNGLSFSVTLLNVTRTASLSSSQFTSAQVLEFVDANTEAIWPRTAPSHSLGRKFEDQVVEQDSHEVPFTLPPAGDVKFPAAVLEQRLRLACENLIAAEPKLTEWDTRMGDGDCGTTLETGAKATLKALDEGLASTGSLFTVVHKIVAITELAMGGTLGAIFGIYLAAFLSALRANAELADESTGHKELLSKAAFEALKNLRTHTPAKENDRTVMDVLIPFVSTYHTTKDFDQAVAVAHQAAEGTRMIQPKLGRATYVGGLDGGVLPPDPGAFGVFDILLGLSGKREDDL
ncbi:dihydroxyacetone kinase [Meredithblackwellia eburnea MCA 4105]